MSTCSAGTSVPMAMQNQVSVHHHQVKVGHSTLLFHGSSLHCGPSGKVVFSTEAQTKS